MQMNLLKIITCVVFAVLSRETLTFSQKPPSSSAIVGVEANRFIGVRIEIHATDGPIYIPVCGSDEGGDHHVCGLASRVQVHVGNDWRPASVRKGLAAVLGGVTKDAWTPLRIAPGETEFIVITIDPGLVDVRRGDQLRVELDSWSSEAAMRTKDSEKRLTSPQFECP